MIENVDSRTERKIRTGQTIRIVVVLAIAAVLVVWGLVNTDDVEVDWIIGTTTGPLIFVIAVAAVVGFLLGLLSARRLRR